MGRPIKAGLDYFPHSCIPDQRMELIEAEFGLTGYAVVLKLYEKIFVEKGYFCEWTKDVALMFSRRNSVGVNVVSEIVNASLRRGLFDDDLFKKYSILTSKEIQEIYHEVTTKLNRKQVDFVKEYLLVDYTLFSDKYKIYSINYTGNAINYTGNAQKKGKERKRKESKVNSSRLETNNIVIPCQNGTYTVTEEQQQLLQQVFKNVDVKEALLKMSDYASIRPERRRNLDSVENWIRKWLTENSNGKFQQVNRSSSNDKHQNVKPKQETSYDIKKFVEFDVFD